MRLIGADRLDSLLQIKEKSDDDNTVTKIQELLRPFEYTKVDKIIDVMFSAAQDVEPVEKLDLGQNGSEEEEDLPDAKRRYTQVRTDRDALNQTRLGAVNGFGEKIRANFHRHRQTLFWTPDKKIRVCAAVSKRYDSTYKPYWYAYHPHWDEFLAEGQSAYFILACMDRDTAFAIPHEVVRRNIAHCSRTERDNGKSYWHIALSHNKAGHVVWDLTKVQKKIDLKEWEFRLKPVTDAKAESSLPLEFADPSSTH